MDSTRIVFFCTMYLMFFFIIGGLIGVAVFPPEPQWVGFTFFGSSVGFYLSFWNVTVLFGVIVSIVILTLAAGIKAFGSGISFDQSFMVTLGVALFFGGLLAWTMAGMMPTVPIQVTAVFVWPFIIALVYGIVAMGRGGG